MLDRETEEHWQTVKESYPDAVVFHESRGLYIVKGRDVQVLAKEFGIECNTPIPWWGFDEGQAWGYMSELAERGYAVVRASKDGVSRVKPPADRKAEIRRQRKKGTFLAVEPRLLFGEREIENSTNDRWLKRRAYERLFEEFKRWLQDDDRRSLGDFGELYIYQVSDLYEIDFELTSMLDGHVLLLAKAAFATGRKLPCRVVEPKCRRERKGRKPSPALPTEKAPRLGQLSFEDFMKEQTA